MSEKKDVRKIENVGGGLSKEEAQKVFGGKPECICLHRDEFNLIKVFKFGPYLP